LRSDAAARCGTPQKCSFDPLYREVTRTLVHTLATNKLPLEAKAAALSVGTVHAGRGTAAGQVWASQMAYRKLHPEVKEPAPMTEEAADETAALDATGIDTVRGEVASPSGHTKGMTTIAFKDPMASKHCDETGDIDSFDGAIEQTRIIYKQNCTNAAPPKVQPIAVPDAEATSIKPGMTVVAVVQSSSKERKAEIVSVWQGDKLIQLGPDKFLQASGDPLKGQP
jgi:hypothetical protein